MTKKQYYKDVKLAVVTCLQNLEISPLRTLTTSCVYNDTNREDLIEEIERTIVKIRNEGFSYLEAEPSKCKFCYPTADTYNFNNPYTGEVIIRYVIHQESINRFIIEECRNRKLSDGENGLPF